MATVESTTCQDITCSEDKWLKWSKEFISNLIGYMLKYPTETFLHDRQSNVCTLLKEIVACRAKSKSVAPIDLMLQTIEKGFELGQQTEIGEFFAILIQQLLTIPACPITPKDIKVWSVNSLLLDDSMSKHVLDALAEFKKTGKYHHLNKNYNRNDLTTLENISRDIQDLPYQEYTKQDPRPTVSTFRKLLNTLRALFIFEDRHKPTPTHTQAALAKKASIS